MENIVFGSDGRRVKWCAHCFLVLRIGCLSGKSYFLNKINRVPIKNEKKKKYSKLKIIFTVLQRHAIVTLAVVVVGHAFSFQCLRRHTKRLVTGTIY